MSRRLLASPLSASLLCVLALAAASCTTGQTGGEIEVDDRGETNSERCEEVGQTPLADDAAIELGPSAADVAGTIEGTHEATLDWGVQVPESLVTATPASGDSNISVTIEVLPDTARVVDLEQPEVDDEDGDRALAEIEIEPCHDELRVDARVTVTSENGALNDSFDATFATTDGLVITSRIDLPEELEGSFSVQLGEDVPNGKHTEWIEITFALGNLSGQISGTIESSDGAVAMGAGALYGTFPADGCEYGYLIDSDSDWGLLFTALRSEHTEFNLAWDGGSSTTMTVAPTMGQLCFEQDVYSAQHNLTFGLTAGVTTADNSITGTWDLAGRATVQADGSLSEVNVFRDNYLGMSYPAATFAESTGITGVTSDAEYLSFQFGYVIDPAGQTATYGSMAILELVVPECAQEGYEPEITEDPDGGSSSPGCEGVDFVEAATATLSETPPAPAE
jgi:hypothetical protein